MKFLLGVIIGALIVAGFVYFKPQATFDWINDHGKKVVSSVPSPSATPTVSR